jgi:hypothetical protein
MKHGIALPNLPNAFKLYSKIQCSANLAISLREFNELAASFCFVGNIDLGFCG